jgi:GDPmannose 4,6-dehydratase
MDNKRALIMGITGQDGSWLAEYLLGLGYNVFGLIRRQSITENQYSRIANISGSLNLEYGDLLDISSLENIIKLSQPDEIYSLASQSHVQIGSDIPLYTTQVNTLGIANLLETYRNFASNAKFIQASSSEMFGNCCDEDGWQREDTDMQPVSVYGCTKLFGYNMTKYYRRAFNLFACNSICFNHEGSRRGENFVTQKIVKGCVEISLGLSDKLILGNLKAHRDWSDARDIVRAMHMIIGHIKPDDFVVSSMETHSIEEFCDIVFKKLNMDYRDYVKIDKKFFRPEELKYLNGDSTKIRKILGWKPKYNFEQLIDSMIENWQNKLSKKYL